MLLYCDVYIAFSKRSFISAVSLLSSYIAHFNVLHRSFTLSICSSPLYFYICLSIMRKKKLLRNNCFSFFYFLVENCTYVGCLLLVHLKDNAVFLHVYDMIP